MQGSELLFIFFLYGKRRRFLLFELAPLNKALSEFTESAFLLGKITFDIKLMRARTAKSAASARGAGQFFGFFKIRVQGGQHDQLRHFLSLFKDKFRFV